MEMLQKALDCYVKGNAFKKAVDLAKIADPRIVTSLEERWGNYLMSIKQTQAAINHFIEADKTQKAIEAAILAREWNKAIQLLTHQTPEIARPYYRQIAKHYASIRQYDFAEKYFLKAALPVDGFEMYAQAGKWENALRLAKENLPESEINNLYVKQARKFEEEEKWKEAEKMYLIVEEYDLAIAMYKKCGQYDNMIRLVAKYRNNLLK
jgi:intraflagellar transport protein 172